MQWRRHSDRQWTLRRTPAAAREARAHRRDAPTERRACPPGIHPVERAVDHFVGGPAKPCSRPDVDIVIDVEPAPQSAVAVEYHRADERGRAITRSLQSFGEHRQPGFKRQAVHAGAVRRGNPSREEAAVRRQRQRHGCDGPLEDNAFPGELLDGWQLEAVVVRRQMIGTRRIERDQDHACGQDRIPLAGPDDRKCADRQRRQAREPPLHRHRRPPVTAHQKRITCEIRTAHRRHTSYVLPSDTSRKRR